MTTLDMAGVYTRHDKLLLCSFDAKMPRNSAYLGALQLVIDSNGTIAFPFLCVHVPATKRVAARVAAINDVITELRAYPFGHEDKVLNVINFHSTVEATVSKKMMLHVKITDLRWERDDSYEESKQKDEEAEPVLRRVAESVLGELTGEYTTKTSVRKLMRDAAKVVVKG